MFLTNCNFKKIKIRVGGARSVIVSIIQQTFILH